jgi:hypothetical protein
VPAVQNLLEQRAIFLARFVAGQRVAVFAEGRVQFGPVAVGEVHARSGQHFRLFQRHVFKVEARVLFNVLLETRPARFTQHLPGQQRVFQRADAALARFVVAFQPVQH